MEKKTGTNFEKERQYWLDTFSDLPEVSRIPYDSEGDRKSGREMVKMEPVVLDRVVYEKLIISNP